MRTAQLLWMHVGLGYGCHQSRICRDSRDFQCNVPRPYPTLVRKGQMSLLLNWPEIVWILHVKVASGQLLISCLANYWYLALPITDILPCQLDSSVLNNRPSLYNRCSYRENAIIWNCSGLCQRCSCRDNVIIWNCSGLCNRCGYRVNVIILNCSGLCNLCGCRVKVA